jgi:hypothetical protein
MKKQNYLEINFKVVQELKFLLKIENKNLRKLLNLIPQEFINYKLNYINL